MWTGAREAERRGQKKSEPTLPHKFPQNTNSVKSVLWFQLGDSYESSCSTLKRSVRAAVDGKMVGWLVGYLPQRPAATQHSGQLSAGLANFLSVANIVLFEKCVVSYLTVKFSSFMEREVSLLCLQNSTIRAYLEPAESSTSLNTLIEKSFSFF